MYLLNIRFDAAAVNFVSVIKSGRENKHFTQETFPSLFLCRYISHEVLFTSFHQFSLIYFTGDNLSVNFKEQTPKLTKQFSFPLCPISLS